MPPLEIAFFNNLAGDNSEEATPDPIPNSEVKLFSVDGTAWVTMWESRSLPAFFVFARRLRRRFVGRVPSTRLGAFFLLPGICSDKIEKKVHDFVIEVCNSLGKPACFL